MNISVFCEKTIDFLLYKLYTKNMKNSRLTFNSPTNFTLSLNAYWVIARDAYYFDYVKNGNPNIGGFLNDLIPMLVDCQDDLYRGLLKYNGNEEDAQLAARNIYNVYLPRMKRRIGGKMVIPFRISKDRYDDFIHIHDERLMFYDMNFSQYLQTMVDEYTSMRFSDREQLFMYRTMKVLEAANSKQRICKVYYADGIEELVPVSVSASPIHDHNYLVGVTKDEEPIAIRLCDVERVTVTDFTMVITEEMTDRLAEHLKTIYDKEYAECSE